MELTQQVTELDKDFKLLKGEIKNILKELRTAFLNNDNPFALDKGDPDAAAGPPTFRAVSREEPAEEETPEEEPEEESNYSLEGGPSTPPGDLAGGPSTPSGDFSGGPSTPPGDLAGGPSTPPGDSPALSGPTPLQTEPEETPGEEETPEEEETPAPAWNLLTIASLAAWAEESLVSLGPKRLRFVLELACFADVVSPEVQEMLSGVIELAPADEKREDRPMNVNDCLVVVRQLEAIIQGETVTKLPRRRSVRCRKAR